VENGWGQLHVKGGHIAFLLAAGCEALHRQDPFPRLDPAIWDKVVSPFVQVVAEAVVLGCSRWEI
jgi:hypothetical protein